MSQHVDRVGQQVGNYRLEQLLGTGGFAEVYLGRQVFLESLAAIKLLHANLAQAESEGFRAEAVTLVRLIHPHIVRILDFGVEGTTPFLVMDYAPHGTLRQRHWRGERLPLTLVVDYVKQIAEALQYAHDQNIIHRDIKPENMLVGRQQEIVLSDFGIAVVAHSTQTGLLYNAIGTMTYMAPEQLQGQPRKASDQYALGAVVYEWLTGSPPFTGSFTEIAAGHLIGSVRSLRDTSPSLPPAVEQVVLTALAKDPKQRFESVRVFATRLDQASQGRTVTTPAPALSSPSVTGSPLPVTPWLPLDAGQEGDKQEEVRLMNAPTIAGAPASLDAGATSKSSATEREQQSVTQRPWNVPFLRNAYFTGRAELLGKLHELLSAAPTHIKALSGLGGIGKTQTAIEYAYRYRGEYSAVFWVRADSRETLVADYVALARLLGLPGQDAQDQMLIVAATKRWLEQQEGWLLILDNADELSIVTDFLPAAGQGHLLLTTRAQATGKIAQSLSVEKMGPSEGMQLLLHRAKLLAPEEPLDTVSGAGRKAAQTLVEELDGLPLALDQAGAYIEETGCSISEYLGLYAHHHLALLQQQSSVSDDYPHTVASTWALSFSQVEQLGPAAADLLRLCAFLHPDAIPEAIVTEGAAELGPLLSPVATNTLLLNAAIQLLRRYSLVKRDPDLRLLYLHRLVQVVLKENLDKAAQREWAERSVRAVNRAFPEAEFASWERCELCLPHALLCAQWIEQYGFTFPEAARLLHAVGTYLRDRAQYAQAELLLKRALALREQVLGAEHPDTASTLNVLADLYIFQSDYQQAEGLMQPALANFERALGSEHPEVATALNTLGGVYMHEGKYAQAEPLYQRALAIREQVLGKKHPLVAESLSNLATVYNFQGKYAQAQSLYQRSLTLYEDTVGPEHPDALITLSNLALPYMHQGKYAQAEPFLERALATRERVLGPEHPNTAVSLQLLGRLYTLQGKYTQAEPLLQRALALHERLLGREHDFTIRDLLFLGHLSQATGQDARAESVYQQALALFERVLGPEHPRVAETLTRLAQLSTRQGHYQQAEPLLERALAIAEQALGPEHPQTAPILDAQGHLALLQGREEQAETLLQRALAIQEKTLGNSHPEVAKTLHHLAQLYEKQGKHEQAHSLYQQALSIQEHALGADHPDTKASREALTRLLQRLQAEGQQGSTTQPGSVPPA